MMFENNYYNFHYLFILIFSIVDIITIVIIIGFPLYVQYVITQTAYFNSIHHSSDTSVVMTVEGRMFPVDIFYSQR